MEATPRPLYPWERDRVTFVQEDVWAPFSLWKGAENHASPEFDPRTFQSVISRYTDWANPAPLHIRGMKEMYVGKSISKLQIQVATHVF